jgi:hypothetical protein
MTGSEPLAQADQLFQAGNYLDAVRAYESA